MVKLIIPILLIFLGLVSDTYIFHRYINFQSMWRWIWWLPMAIVIGFVLYFVFLGKGVGYEHDSVNLFLLLMGLFCLPKIIFTLLSFIPKVGGWIGLMAGAIVILMIVWGVTFGFTQIRVRHIVYESPYVPKSFDGYRIAQIADIHTGTFSGVYEHLLRESVDTINSLQPDLICVVGDIENFLPKELEVHSETFSALHAKDGVLSVMGNHDYSAYVKVSAVERAAMVAKTRSLQRSFGWRLLENEHCVIFRDVKEGGVTYTDSIVVVGEENWGKRPFPQLGNLTKATKQLSLRDKRVRNSHGEPAFTIMLSHDPTAWRAHILPFFHPDITLSGHTHGMQISAFGWSPASMVYKEWGGVYYDKDHSGTDPQKRMLSVSTGIGGNFPFRLAMPREVVLVTLKHKD